MRLTKIILVIICLFSSINLFSQDEIRSKENKEKKIEIEFSSGIARVNPVSIYQRSSGLDEMLNQYAQYYVADYSDEGKFLESKLFIPFSLSINYRLNKKMYLEAGLDYSFSNSTSEKSYQVSWSEFYEQYDFELTRKVSCVMPHFGVGYRHASFDFYGGLGIGIARFNYTENLHFSESGSDYSFDTDETFKVKGTSPGIIIGIKYRLPLAKKNPGSGFSAFIKMEAVLLKIKSFTGTKTTIASDSRGERNSQTQEGTLYQFQWNPFESQGFDYWDLFDTIPTDSAMRNVEEMGMDLSGIRIMIGISF